MSTIAVGEVPADEFALYRPVDVVPDVEFERERVVENGDEISTPIIWAGTDAVERLALDQALEADDSVSDATALADFDGEWLYRMAWVEQTELVLQVLLSARNDTRLLRKLEELAAPHRLPRAGGAQLHHGALRGVRAAVRHYPYPRSGRRTDRPVRAHRRAVPRVYYRLSRTLSTCRGTSSTRHSLSTSASPTGRSPSASGGHMPTLSRRQKD